MKKCRKCGVEKPLTEFHKDKSKKGGRHSSCKCCKRLQGKKYLEANREKKAASNRAYYENNREAMREYKKAYREANPEKIAESRKAYYENNRESIREKHKAYREANYTPTPEWEARKELPHKLYLIRFTQGNRTYLKVGITFSSVEVRFWRDVREARMSNPEVIREIEFSNYESCCEAEYKIHTETLNSHVKPVIAFNGSVRECRDVSALEKLLLLFKELE